MSKYSDLTTLEERMDPRRSDLTMVEAISIFHGLIKEVEDLRDGQSGVGYHDYLPDYLRMCDAHRAQRLRIQRAIDMLDGRA